MEPANASSATLWSYPIVVGIDFDPVCEYALQEAIRIVATRPGAMIHAVHVVHSASMRPGIAAQISHNEAVHEETLRKLKEFVANVAARMPEARGQQVTLHHRVGSPAEVILQLAVDVNADLMIVGTHGRSALARLAVGSVASRLLEISRCPVLVVRPKDYRGLTPSPTIDPVCPDCARVRAESGDVTRWCELHSQSHPRPHVMSYDEVNPLGRTGAGINDGT